ncbi:hypothetical protein [Streptomyces chattanoogensis]|uniref:Uncharacterized protein n=1 Tax=Streptomyces chattanoogensis TaxID=66876 RepID=A0A0N1JYS8_9ACTN|nr:hypothetical protein [Streptomyces chattanoogensis]KPC64247.1 hypothetical protein ADL29_11955 [Streptomyces chattanoogensis]
MKFDQNERDVERPAKPTTLEMPRQAPPIDRTGHTSAGGHDDTRGVEASDFLDTLTKILQI